MGNNLLIRGSWNVMWERHRQTHLKDAVDFLKIGHHGSINAIPPAAELQPKPKQGAEDLGAASIYRMLDTLLPAPKSGKPTAQAIVSTEREFYNPIPECAVLPPPGLPGPGGTAGQPAIHIPTTDRDIV